MEIIKKQYGAISLINIVSDVPQEWDISGATHVRVSLPSDIRNMLAMQQMGYEFAERMLDVTVSLPRLTADLEKVIRIKPVLEKGRRDEIRQLAVKSFGRDRRFHIETMYNNEVAAAVIDGWIAEIPEFFICTYKEKLIGFLALKEDAKEKSAAIHLAAVDERYRVSGAAMSLYAAAIKAGKERDLRNITGCISSCNTAVINLYAYFGGTFSNPQDIYLKKINEPKC